MPGVVVLPFPLVPKGSDDVLNVHLPVSALARLKHLWDYGTQGDKAWADSLATTLLAGLPSSDELAQVRRRDCCVR